MKVNSRAWKKYLGKIVGKNLTWKIWKEVGKELSDCWHFVTTIISLCSGNFCTNCWERKLIRLIAKPIKVNLFVEK